METGRTGDKLIWQCWDGTEMRGVKVESTFCRDYVDGETKVESLTLVPSAGLELGVLFPQQQPTWRCASPGRSTCLFTTGVHSQGHRR